MKFSEFLKIKHCPPELDSDYDGLPDREELAWGTDPFKADTDGDGMNDGDEIKAGRNPLGAGLLKDLFIPHKGNDFKPHALHPKRLAFHALTAVAIKMLVIGFIVSLPIEAWLAPDVFQEQGRKIIALTNQIRNEKKLSQLKENSSLDQAAYIKVQDMLANQYFAHVSPEQKGLSDWLRTVKYNYAVAGENLAMGFFDVNEVVDKWRQSQTHYANIVDPSFSEIGVSMVGGKFEHTDTTFIAQMFGGPSEQAEASETSALAKNKPTIKAVVKKTGQKGKQPGKQIAKAKKKAPIPAKTKKEVAINKKDFPSATLADVATATPILININSTEPTIDQARTRLIVSQPDGEDTRLIHVEAYLSADVAKAQARFSDQYLELFNEDGAEPQKWTGNLTIFAGNDSANEIIIPASITAWNEDGLSVTTDISIETVKPNPASYLQEYYFLKSHPTKNTARIFSISSLYFSLILTVAIVALLLNVFIEIRKQHPHLIASAVSLIGLLAILIVF